MIAESKQSNNDAAATILRQVKEVSKTFTYPGGSQKHVVLDRFSIDVNGGEFVTIIGPSGCGKSTLISVITGLENLDSGSISRKGESKVSTDPGGLVIFQEGVLFPWLTVSENIELGLKLAGIPKERLMQVVQHHIQIVQLSRFSDSYIYQLSSGMKQRVAIAHVFAMDPGILLMDEPFAAFDAHTRDMLYSEFLRIHEKIKRTVLFITHNIGEALALGTLVLLVLSRTIGGIKQEFMINLSRPRNTDSPEISIIRRQILKELEEDLQIARKENATDATRQNKQ